MRRRFLLPWAVAILPLTAPAATPLLESVLVTAREESETRGMRLSGDELLAAGLNRGRDLAERVPALQVQVTTTRLASYSLRGLGSSSFNDGLESSVAMTVDGVWLGRQGMFLSDLGDLEEVDVRRGPQGVLAGHNASAGLIAIRTRKPAFQPEAEVEASVGSDHLRQLRSHLSGALFDDTLAGRLSLTTRQRDGWVENGLSGARFNDEDRYGLRGQLLWMPSTATRARLIAEYAREAEACCAFVVGHYAAVSRASADFVGYRLPPADPWQRRVELDRNPTSEVRQRVLTLQVDHDLGGHHLASITGWRDWRYAGVSDVDGIGLAIVEQGGTQLSNRQFSQELRLSGTAGDALDYVTGAYFLTRQMQRNGWLQFGADAADWYAGSDPRVAAAGLTAAVIDDALLQGALVETPGRQRSETWALFGQLAWQATPRLQLTPGLRYNHESKRGSASRRQRHLPALDPFDPVGFLLGSILQGAAAGRPYLHHASLSEHHLSWQFDLDYQLAARTAAYARWSRGFKGGGINAEPVSTGVDATFEAERATLLEVGLQHDFRHRSGRLQFALYQTEVADYQALTYAAEAATANPQRDNLMNVGTVRSRGVDVGLDLELQPGAALRLGVAWNDARYREFANAPCPPGSGGRLCDLSGRRLFNAPEWSVGAGLDISRPLTPALELLGGVDWLWRSGFDGTLERGEGSYQASRGLTHVRLGLRDRQGGWELTGWVRNLFDKHYIAAIYALTGTGDYGAIVGDPRSYGVTLRLAYR